VAATRIYLQAIEWEKMVNSKAMLQYRLKFIEFIGYLFIFLFCFCHTLVKIS